MSTLYVESSAVLAWLFGESRSAEFLKRVNRSESVVTSCLTLLEIERALIRAERQQVLTVGACHKLRGLFARATASWILMEISEEVRLGAGRTFPIEPVRTLDAIHLSTALIFTQAYPELQLLSFDHRIAENAIALGIG